jgi:hypothetical protein
LATLIPAAAARALDLKGSGPTTLLPSTRGVVFTRLDSVPSVQMETAPLSDVPVLFPISPWDPSALPPRIGQAFLSTYFARILLDSRDDVLYAVPK